MSEGLKVLRLVAKICFALVIVFAILYGGYGDLDGDGWMPHTRTVSVFMTPDWLQGESRECHSAQLPGENNIPEVVSLYCPGDTSNTQGHDLPVRFWGKVSRPEAFNANRVNLWRCVRKSDEFTCYAVD